jgi:hypothetical protein
MNNKKELRDELKNVSPVVANIGNENVFTVPENYFNSLAAHILSKANEIHLPFTFMPFTVPDNYFQNLPQEILYKIHAEKPLKTSHPFTMPAGFFDGLANNILQKIKASENAVYKELETIAPLLNTIEKKPQYYLPAAYFENLIIEIPSAEKQTAKIISIASKTRKWITYAVAACLFTILGMGSYLFINNHPAAKNTKTSYATFAKINVEQGIARLSDDDIADYLTAHNTSSDILNESDYDPDFTSC